jgi:dTDP-4-dehydrorhamnose reductase
MIDSTFMLSPLELWGGLESTFNRVGDVYFDQLERSGHATRLGDLDLFAGLGIRALRYPVSWERIAPNGLDSADWSWADERLEYLCALGIRPIAGLVHHGSGPRHTSLVDPSFPEGLAAFARAVAERYPWIESYTPINEPLTTARFSGLYGLWYPHGQDNVTFIRALLIQCRAVAQAMQAIRAVNPSARLVQTDDLGKTYSTPTLTYQAELENERRWLTFDLLCGRVDAHHSLWKYLRASGATESELHWFVEHPCPPDIIGINHYITSERFLDERLERYPAHQHGGNEQHRYADVESVRVHAEGPAGFRVLLREAAERYALPLAVTEAHQGCTREEQMRWLLEAWQSAQELCREGVDVRAVTAWSLLGAFDWNKLVTACNGFYEPGVFDIRGPRPRPTALAWLMRDLAAGREPDHPVLDVPGWWRRPLRFFYPPVHAPLTTVQVPPARQPLQKRVRPLAISGATGTLGKAFARLCELRGIPYRLLSRQEMDITSVHSVMSALKELEPWALVNASGYVRVDEAEQNFEACERVNARGPAILAAACQHLGIRLLTYSSDLVFDGRQSHPYIESDSPAPLCVYGKTKADGEARTLSLCPSALVVRTSSFFGPWDDANFVTQTLRKVAAGFGVVAAGDVVVTPTYVPDLVHASLDLLLDREEGLWHLTNSTAVTWYDLARRAVELAHLDAGMVEAGSVHDLGYAACRPSYSALGSERGMLLPSLDDALTRYLLECEVEWEEQTA